MSYELSYGDAMALWDAILDFDPSENPLVDDLPSAGKDGDVIMKICPECGCPVQRGEPVSRSGWSVSVDPERLRWQHLDGEPLCPEITARGYQPAAPVDA